MIRDDLFYTEDHEWIRIEGEYAYEGITDYAQGQLSDIVYIELPQKGEEYTIGDVIGSIEAVKTVAEIKMALSGEIVDVNEDVVSDPSIIHQSPYEDGWFIKIKISDEKEVERLMNAQQYQEFIQKGE